MSLSEIPIVVGSKNCNLKGLTPEELIKNKEDCNEFGGYFIINGNEKLVRMLIMSKRNYPIAFQRNTFLNRDTNFTKYAVSMKCVRKDLFS